jgi:hypothetical protein
MLLAFTQLLADLWGQGIMLGAFDQKPARMSVTAFGDWSLMPGGAGAVFAADQAQISYELANRSCGSDCRRDDESNGDGWTEARTDRSESRSSFHLRRLTCAKRRLFVHRSRDGSAMMDISTLANLINAIAVAAGVVFAAVQIRQYR